MPVTVPVSPRMGAIVVINSRTPSPRSSFLTCLFAVRDNVSSSAVASRSQMGAKNRLEQDYGESEYGTQENGPHERAAFGKEIGK